MSWPDKNDREVVHEMMENPDSPEWQKCYAFLTARIKHIFRGGYPEYVRDDIVQEAMTKVFLRLATFSYKCPLGVWLAILLTRTAIDYFRKWQTERNHVSLSAFQDTGGEELELMAKILAPEDHCLTRVTINELVNGYRAWLKEEDPENAERNFAIWSRHVLQGQSVKHIADCLNVSIHIIYRVLREARKYFSQFRRQS